MDREIAQMDGTALGRVAGDVGLARYRLGGQRRAWLAQQDLADGVTGGDILVLPPLGEGALERELDISPFDTSKWTSARVSDVGYCSIEIGWARTGTVGSILGIPLGGFAGLLTRAVDGAIIGGSSIRGARRIVPGLVQPTFRAERHGGRLVPHDSVHFATDFVAELITDNGVVFGTPLTCSNVTINVDFDFSVRVNDTALISVAPQCLEPSGAGGTLSTDRDPAFDHVAVVEAVDVDISDACAYEGVFEGEAERLVRGLLPELFARVVRDAGVIDPRGVGIADADIRRCTCDADCNRFSPQGPAFDPAVVPRPRCHFPDGVPPAPSAGECWIQMEFDRVEFTPQGLEVVISESPSDVQQAMLEALVDSAAPGARGFVCDPDRNWVDSDIDLDDPTSAAQLVRTLRFPVMSP